MVMYPWYDIGWFLRKIGQNQKWKPGLCGSPDCPQHNQRAYERKYYQTKKPIISPPSPSRSPQNIKLFSAEWKCQLYLRTPFGSTQPYVPSWVPSSCLTLDKYCHCFFFWQDCMIRYSTLMNCSFNCREELIKSYTCSNIKIQIKLLFKFRQLFALFHFHSVQSKF